MSCDLLPGGLVGTSSLTNSLGGCGPRFAMLVVKICGKGSLLSVTHNFGIDKSRSAKVVNAEGFPPEKKTPGILR